jgi:hypothetical protein
MVNRSVSRAIFSQGKSFTTNGAAPEKEKHPAARRAAGCFQALG